MMATSRHDREKDAALSFRDAGRVAISARVQTAPQIDLKTPSPRVAPTYPKVEPTDPKVSMISCNGFPVASHASGSAQKATFEFVAHHRHAGDREKARVIFSTCAGS